MMVRQSIVVSSPASTLAFMAGPSDDSTPMTRIFGLKLLTAIDTPEMSPPPPMGTTTASTSGQGTLGLEIVQDWPGGDAVGGPIGGGGRNSGGSMGGKSFNPQ